MTQQREYFRIRTFARVVALFHFEISALEVITVEATVISDETVEGKLEYVQRDGLVASVVPETTAHQRHRVSPHRKCLPLGM